MTKDQSMAKRVQTYLAYRRRCGFQLKIEESVLFNFAYFADSKAAKDLTTQLAIEWALSSKSKKRLTYARRIEVLRPFAKYCSLTFPKTEIPHSQLFGKAHQRQAPYIYSNDEIRKLLEATKYLIPQQGLRLISFYYLFSLLYATGMRVSEALNLKADDIDWKNGVLKINQTKFQKSRLIPLHSTATAALSHYYGIRAKYVSPSACQSFFVLDKGIPITYPAIQYAFLRLRKILKWHTKTPIPRIYDLRHTFVCHRLLKWYEGRRYRYHDCYSLSVYLFRARQGI